VAGGIAQMGVFPASLSFPELKIPQLEMERVIGCRLGWKSEKDDGFLMLLGRDILRNFLFIYDGVHDELIIGH
jgi:hypothetical protein